MGIVTSIAAGNLDPSTCDASSGVVAVVGVVLTLVGGLLIGGGWAMATRSTWVVLATIAVLDAWIFYFNLIVGADDPEAVRGLLLLAFAIHGICTTVAARWSFVAKDLGPIERAKAGEAGRTLSAVWAFLAAYTALTLIRADSGIFDTAAGSAVTGALSLGALAVTMGSGFTKYAEAINAKPAGAVGKAAGPGRRPHGASRCDASAATEENALRPGPAPSDAQRRTHPGRLTHHRDRAANPGARASLPSAVSSPQPSASASAT